MSRCTTYETCTDDNPCRRHAQMIADREFDRALIVSAPIHDDWLTKTADELVQAAVDAADDRGAERYER